MIDPVDRARTRAGKIRLFLKAAAVTAGMLMGASWVFAQVAGPVPMTGSGGSTSTTGGFITHTFTTSGSFVAPPGVTSVQVLTIGGGGAGGTGSAAFVGGGGGSGDVIEGVISVTPGTLHQVNIGAGGTAATTAGGATSFVGNTTQTAAGGGRGGGTANVNGSAGASGGGAGVSGTAAGTPGGQSAGFTGGTALWDSNVGRRAAGGGGGQTAAGSAGTRSGNSGNGGAGGAGVQVSAAFGSVVYGGGGGGGGKASGGTGGTGGAGSGTTGVGGDATANTGSGGGGGGSGAGGTGGSGRVMIRYQDFQPQIRISQQTISPAANGAVLPQPIQVLLTSSSGGPNTPIASPVTITATLASGSGSLDGTLSRQTASGIATFDDLIINGTGNHTIRFSVANVTGEVISNVIVVQDAVAQDLSINQAPSAVAQDGIALAVQPVIAAIDGNGVPMEGLQITASLVSGLGTLTPGATTAITDENGLATFSNLAITGGGPGPRVLRFTATDWTQIDSGNIEVTVPALMIQTQPSPSAINGQLFAAQPVVEVLDVYGAPVNGVQVTVALNSGAAALGGGPTATSDANGLATFTNLAITGVDGDRTLIFSAPGWSDVISGTIAVSAEPLEPLAVQVQPSLTSQSGVALAVAPVIVALDGITPIQNVEVTASIVSGDGVLGGTTQVLTDAQGEAAFPGLVINGNTGNYILRFSADDWTAADSDTIVLSEPLLVISQQPSAEAESGDAFPVQPVIEVRDIYNNLVQGVQVSVAAASGTGVLGGTQTATSNINGLAVFSNLALTGPAGDNTLVFSASTWSDVVSATITIPQPDTLTIDTQPSALAQSELVLAQQPVVAAIDPDSNPIAGIEITASLLSGGGTLLGTTTATTDALGLATFTDLAISGSPGDRVLRFTADDWELVDSATVSIQMPTLAMDTQPSVNAVSASALGTQPVILVEDVYGQPVEGLTVTASLETGNGVLGGTLSVASDVNGLAAFADLAITGSGDHTLAFNAPGFNEVVSSVVSVSQPPGACSNFQTGLIGSQRVLLAGCMDAGVGSVDQVTILVPPGTEAGDLLVTVFSSRGSSINVNTLAGWTNLMNANTTNNNGGGSNRQSLIIRTRIADGTEPPSYTFTTSATAQTYAFMMRFTGASGAILQGTPFVSSNANPAVAPDLATAVEDSLILRLAAVQGATSMVANQDPVIPGLRNITQDFFDTSFGSGAYFNQETIASVGTQAFVQTGGGPGVAQTLAIEPEPVLHYIDIDHETVYPMCQASTPVTVTVRNLADDSIATGFEGVVTVSNSGSNGSYAVSGYPGNFSNLGGGAATYEFVAADDGQVILDYTATAANAALTFNASSGFIARDEAYALSMNVGNCSFSITHAGTGGTCAANPITVAVLDHLGAPVVDYTGQITLTAAPGTGNWSNGLGAPGVFDNGVTADGIAQYTFVDADDGDVTLGFRNSVAAAYSFTVAAANVPTTSFNSGNMVITACQFRISFVDSTATGDVCRAEQIAISVVDAGANPVSFVGNMNISTAGVTGGNWSKTTTPTDANGTLTETTPDDGAAQYAFVAADEGTIILRFQNKTAQTVNFNLSASGVSQPAGIYDPDHTVNACVFRVQHVGGATTDVCSIKEIDVTLVDSSGVTVTTYTGTVNLSTTSGGGTWIDGGNGLLNDPVAEDGNATYNFVPADAGTVRLQFRHGNATGTTNINVSDGTTLDPRNFVNAYDQNLTVNDCSFEISHGMTSTACTVEDIEITVRNSVGGIAVDYTGTMNISTSTNHGNWATSSGLGNLVEIAGDDNGVAAYTFDTDDNGVVVLQFTDLNPEYVSINLADGAISEDGALDELLQVTSCFPNLTTDTVCVNPGNSANIAIPARNSNVEQAGRMLLMVTMQSGTTDIATAQFDGAAMTRIYQEKNSNGGGVTTELWGIADANMPAAAGTYSAGFTGGNANTAMCLLSVDQVSQTFPTPEVPGDLGPVNGTQITGNAEIMETRITSSSNNAFVLSALASIAQPVSGAELQNYFTAAPQPATVLAREWGGPGDVLYTNNRYGGGSVGVQSAVGVLEVSEELFNDYIVGFPIPVTHSSHIVAAFSPLIAGDPLAEGYDPVVLFETFSGNMSYHAIGNSLRTNPSNIGVNAPPTPAVDCSMVDFAVGREATLDLPVGAMPVASYLYWFGSGDEGDIDDTVSFGITGAEIAISADEVFTIEGVTTESVDFFAAYKNVSALVAGNGNYTLKNFVVQTGAPWNTNGTCAGGWSLITVYEHPNERLRVLNLFHGFQPFQNSAFTLVPRNFRMATYDPPYVPNGQVTHVTLEGDEQLDTGDESLGLQDAPGSANFTPITSSLNPPNSEFNSTVTRPVYELVDDYFERDDDGGLNGDGYEIDFAGADALEAGRTGKRIGSTWGVDVDTHYIGPDLLVNFSQDGTEAEQITTRYSAGQDLVMLISEVISITNFPLADVEILKTQVGTFKVNGTGTYQFEVRNNGNGSLAGGEATGVITVTDSLPTGMTFTNAGDVSGTGWICSVTLSPGAFTCTYDIAATWPGGELETGASLPLITASVKISDSTFFPAQNNNAKNTARLLHSGGNCTLPANGISPDPEACDRSPQFDNVNDLQGGSIDLNDLDDGLPNNNNVDSVTSIVKGIEVDLRMQKSVVDILEAGEVAQYTLRVSNLGPDATTSTMTVTDTQPAGVTFQSASGTGWVCGGVPGSALTCTHGGPLASGAFTDITVNVLVTGVAGDNVTNTAQVAAGPFNFDVAPGNNVSTDVTTIVGPPVASQERFLLSVSTPGNDTSIGGLNNFENHDLIIYDPLTDEAVMFFDNSALGYGVVDIDAVHLMKNGHIIVSARSTSTIGTNNLAFEPWDLVRYDPILQTATMFLQGSTVFSNHTTVNISALYVMEDGSVLVTTDNGGIAGSNNLAFTRSDIIRYDPSTGLATMFLDGSDSHVFGAEDVHVDAYYMRVDPSDPNDVIPVHIMSTSNEDATLGAGGDPVGGTQFTRDDVVQLDLTTAAPGHESENLFLGDVEAGVFEPIEAARTLDALHVVEDGYIGHFSIKAVANGNICTPTQVRISKHEGLTHARDTDYFGSILISTSTGTGDWAIVSNGGGSINNGAANDGQAIYTYAPGDLGTVVLSLTNGEAGPVSVNVSNGIAREIASEDTLFDFDAVYTPITFADHFENPPALNNNDGSLYFASAWEEVDAFNGTLGSGSGVGTGNVRVLDGEARFTSNPNTIAQGHNPSLTRTIDFEAIPFTEDVELEFDFRYTGLAGADSFVIEFRPDNLPGTPWTLLHTLSGFTGSGADSRQINISSALDDQTYTDTAQIRFRVGNGYAVENYMYIDNVVITTATDECGYDGVVVLDHYAISHAGTGIACLATAITISGHDVGNGLIAPEESILITSSTGKGTWARILAGNGVLSGASALPNLADNGIATYTFPPGESQVTLLFNHTITGNVNINVMGQTSGRSDSVVLEDPDLAIAEAGLRFYNETLADESILTQIAGKNSDVGFRANTLTIQAVRTSDENPNQCLPIFAPGSELSIGFAAECKDANSCVVGEAFQINGQNIALVDNNGAADAAGYTEINVPIVTQPSTAPAGTIVLNYSDVGNMQLHARYNIPFDNDPLETFISGDFLLGSSQDFVVRPFGLDIDFSNDRATGQDSSYAADADGSLWRVAGEAFDTTITAVAWQQGDDQNNDGQPDPGADLTDNRATPNFDQDSGNTDYSVLVSIVQTRVPGGVDGVLTDPDFDNFIAGAVTHSMNYNEVGIIDLRADIVDSSDNVIPYMATDSVLGEALYVGRFYPDQFTIAQALLNSRADLNCTPASTFTYMDEEFEVDLVLEAVNINGNTTVNYRGDFAKLATYADLQFRAVTDVDMEDDIDRSARLVRGTSPTAFPATFQAQWANGTEGVLEIAGNLVVVRAMPGVPDGPFDQLQIAFNPTDSDGVTVPSGVLNVDLDEVLVAEPGDPLYALIAEHDFRYGRLRIDNAYGPETEPLAITLRVEYYDGERFVVSRDDSCSMISSIDMSFVSGSFTDDLVEGVNEPEIWQDIDDQGQESTFYEGLIQGFQPETSPAGDPLRIDPPSTGSGGVDIELDLDALGLSYLRYEWRDTSEGDADGDANDDDEDYDDFPRARIEYGQFRNHDRVIHWQEIYNGATP